MNLDVRTFRALWERALPYMEAQARARLDRGRPVQAECRRLGREVTLELCADAVEHGWASDLIAHVEALGPDR
jgi:hypothetical protein